MRLLGSLGWLIAIPALGVPLTGCSATEKAAPPNEPANATPSKVRAMPIEERPTKERGVGAAEFEAVVAATYQASVGWGRVYQCRVLTSRLGSVPQQRFLTTVSVGKKAWADRLRPEPGRPKSLVMRFRRRPQIRHGPPSGFRDRAGSYWELISVTSSTSGSGSCLPVLLSGGCFVGCIRVDVPIPTEQKFNMGVEACGFAHKVHSVVDDTSGATVFFLVPRCPAHQRYGGLVCSAWKPDAAVCANRCRVRCDLPDLEKYFVSP